MDVTGWPEIQPITARQTFYGHLIETTCITYLPTSRYNSPSAAEDVNHHNYSLDQEKHKYANGISGFGIKIQQEGISGNGDQTDGSLRNALTSGEEFSSSSLWKNEKSFMSRAATAIRILSSYTLLAPMGDNTIAW